MRLDLEIGATTESWSLGPDDRLHSWLRSCPWRSGEFSQARTLSISRVEDVEVNWREIRRLIYAADEGVYSPQMFAPHTIQESRLNALLSVCFFGKPRDLTSLQLKRLVTSRLERAPLVIFLMSSTDLKEQMRGFTETL